MPYVQGVDHFVMKGCLVVVVLEVVIVASSPLAARRRRWRDGDGGVEVDEDGGAQQARRDGAELLVVASGGWRAGSRYRFVGAGEDPIEWCCKFLREEKCLVVIDGLRCKKNWDSIKLALLSDQPNKGSLIIIITNEKTVAEHRADRVRMLRYFKPNPAIPPLIKVCLITLIILLSSPLISGSLASY
jgi:hypothetical protein